MMTFPKKAFLLLIAVTCGACGRPEGSLQVLAVFQSAQSDIVVIPESVVKLRLTVSGPGMNDISKEEAVQASGTIRVDGIPAGSNRTVLLECLEPDDFVSWYGRETTEVKEGQDTKVFLNMLQVPAPPLHELAISINNGEEATNQHIVTLTLQAERAAEYALGLGDAVTDPVWHAYPTDGVGFSLIHSEDLTQDPPEPGEKNGLKTVTVVFRDANQQVSRPYSAQILFDTVPPDVAGSYLTYIPGAGNPLAVVTLATIGTEIRVTVVSDQELSTDPGLEATLWTTCANGTVLTFEIAEERTEISRTFSATVTDILGEETIETCVPIVDWSDSLGNQTWGLALDAMISIKRPGVELAVNQDQVVFIRSPFGNAAEENTGEFTIPAGPYFALAPLEPLEDPPVPCDTPAILDDTFTIDDGARPALLRVWTDSEMGALLGTLAPALNPDSEDYAWPRRQLANQDTPFAWVTGLDQAGNESAPVQILNTEWIISSNLPEYGESRHELTFSRRADEHPFGQQIDGVDRMLVNGDDVSGSDGSAFMGTAQATWTERMLFYPSPVARTRHAMVYDSARGTVMLFGGGDGIAVSHQDTWEWNGRFWEEVPTTADKPMKRHSHAMAYDSARGRTVLFGGVNTTGSFPQDTWEWDGNVRLWTDVTPTGHSPSPRYNHAMAYDSAHRKVVLFGGRAQDGGLLADSWEWDGDTGIWTEVTPEAANPPPREGHTLAYDSARGKIVLFGGKDDSAVFEDTWEWDGESALWTNPVPVNAPPARAFQGAAYDNRQAKVALFGGMDENGQDLQDLWGWDGSGWTELPAATGERPSKRFHHALAYDSARGKVVIFGGLGNPMPPDTWEWDSLNESFRNVTPSTDQPQPRNRPAMAYDTARDKVVLFGGSLFFTYDDTWEWNGSHWTDRTPSGSRPEARCDFAMVYDPIRGKTILFGGSTESDGFAQDTWEWDGTAGSWTEINLAGVKPPLRMGHAMAYDTANQKAILFGGSDADYSPLQDTWEWNSGSETWVEATPSGNLPLARTYHAMAYDGSRGKTVLFGGCLGNCVNNYLQDTWEWDSQTASWEEATPANNNPPARINHTMAYDPDRGRVVMFAGTGYAGTLNDTWEWDGTSWTEVSMDPPPAHRSSHAMVYDESRDRMFVFGDLSFLNVLELDGNLLRQPSMQFRVNLGAAGVENARFLQARIRAHSGGLFYSSGSEAPGATLYAWRVAGAGVPSGSWFRLGENAVGIQPSQPLLPSPDQSLIAKSLLTQDEFNQFHLSGFREMVFQVRPGGWSGAGLASQSARVALDYLEVGIRYRAQE